MIIPLSPSISNLSIPIKPAANTTGATDDE
jgi:hypothetical protein